MINLFWIDKIKGQIHLGARFVQQVNGLVWQEAVLDVAVGEDGSCFDGGIRIADMVVVLVLVLNPLEDGNGFLNRWLVDSDWLHPSLKGRIFFDDTVFVESGSANHLEFTSGQGWLENVAGIHIAITGCTGSNNFMDFVDEEDDFLTVADFLHQFLHPLFELAADTCALNQADDI